MDKMEYFVHTSSYVDEGVIIGHGTKIWHFSHILSGAVIGKNCNFGQNVCISGEVKIGNNVKIQNNVSVYDGVVIEDDVFLGPSCVLTNVSNPRSEITRKKIYEKTIIQKGATIGANSTIVCGISIGRYAFVAAGAVVTRDIPDYTMVIGVPAKRVGWISRHGHQLKNKTDAGFYVCPESGLKYRETEMNILVCLDMDENLPLPEEMRMGKMNYKHYKESKRNPI